MDQMAPSDSDIVQPKVRLRKALHQRLIAAARANKATLNGEIVRRLEASFLHEALEKRLSASSPDGVSRNWTSSALEKQMTQVIKLLKHFYKVRQGSFPANTKISRSPAPLDLDTAFIVRSRRRLKPATSEKEERNRCAGTCESAVGNRGK
jgi:hypothetical protein